MKQNVMFDIVMIAEAESIEKNEDVKNVHDDTSRLTEDQSIQQTIDQAQQTTPGMFLPMRR